MYANIAMSKPIRSGADIHPANSRFSDEENIRSPDLFLTNLIVGHSRIKPAIDSIEKLTIVQYPAMKRGRIGSLSVDGTIGYSSRVEAKRDMRDRVNLLLRLGVNRFKPWNSMRSPVMMSRNAYNLITVIVMTPSPIDINPT